ncbi:hypothetical protein [Paenibacillus sp. YPG26]|uniref:hypothetical protein n=1 Tax=Paenibacillus sp. YPG26 TaxID=2878915 RepID=UPI00203D9F90|nr:hypothetical protein [Paenibacillus sp. YPG26]USB33545.1 hypothetical protein LDO05_01575 [Paenibacillus sp. YPG26]
MEFKRIMGQAVMGLLSLTLICGTFMGMGTKPAAAADQYSQFRNSAVKGPLIAGLEHGSAWVPQGLALVPSKDWVITSHYRGQENSWQVSGLVITSTKTQKRIKTLYLYDNLIIPHMGNVGGLAVSKNHLWIASGYTVYKIPLSTLSEKSDMSRVMMTGYQVHHKASYAAYSDGILWVGEYTDGKDSGKTTCDAGPSGRVYGYKLSSSDDLPADRKAAYSRVTPDRIQGLAISKDYTVYSQSCGRDVSSKLLFYSGETPSKKLGSVTLPPMAEGIAFSGSQLYTLFESGAAKYKGSHYPLKNIYLINVKKLKI